MNSLYHDSGENKSDDDDTFEIIDFYLMQYASDDSIVDVSEMDGFFAALACSPETVLPSSWMPAIWGGEEQSPEWHDTKEFESFSGATLTLYNHVMQSLNNDYFEALFLEKEVGDKTVEIVDEWCHGFLRGMSLWPPLSATDGAFTEEHIQTISLFATEPGFVILEKMDEAEMIVQKKQIEPDVRSLFEYFYKQRKDSAQPVVSESPKIGRNDPCPCGSGKKFKKCCLH